MATKLARVSGIGPCAEYRVFTVREARRWRGGIDDAVLICPVSLIPLIPPSPRSPLAPRITATDDGWALSLVVLCVVTLVPWILGVGWLLTTAMMVVRGWIG